MEKTSEDRDLVLRSREIDEIIGKPPHWLIRSGISIFFFVLLLVGVLSAVIKYPETIVASFNLLSTKSSEKVVSEKNARLSRVFVKEGSYVHQHDTLVTLNTQSANGEIGEIILTSSVEGNVNFTNALQENQQVIKGQTLFSIVPSGSSYIGAIFISPKEIPQLRVGQKINFKLSDYPFEEYGSINGVVDYISAVRKDSLYYVKAILPDGLKLSFGKSIPYREGLSGSAEIVIRDRRLIDKFFGFNNREF